MNIEKIKYDNSLNKLEFKDIVFHTVSLKEIPAPMDLAAKPHNFSSVFIEQLSTFLGDTVLNLIVITPEKQGLPYNVFGYLASKSIVALHFEDTGNFKLWMDVIFEKYFARTEQDINDGKYKDTFNPQFILEMEKNDFSRSGFNRSKVSSLNPYANTGKYLFEKAPNQFNKTSLNQEKQDFIKQYVNTSGTKLDLGLLTEVFSLYLEVKTRTPNPPTDNTETYKTFEKLSGFPFPETLKTLFKLHNGIENSGFLTADQVLQEWKGWKTIYDDVNWTLKYLLENNYSDGNKTLGIYANPYWIPFISTVGGNFIGIDYAPGKEGKSGQIIAFGRDTDTIKFIAYNLYEYLTAITIT